MQTQWETYKGLELIPDSAPEPKVNHFMHGLLLSHLWRSLINALAQEHFYEQRRDYFERCWAIDYADPYTIKHADQLKKLLTLMD
ncbi:hypothetical protein [Stenomitos frigidus]|uniref:Uncharacterized protein n=1 Tax=Stenomitos frigidus ULC18 TaxID=2107698 RepID=A0A2T1DVR1_9CYAN|nr:hypothetical protein [Stenomitos frigidus]PSB24585.1 hypothetical protein C7B82_26550 [Stenomitos frigidus ULC18]